MLSLLPKNLGTVLCLGAHCDDIELGCGGTIQRLAKAYPDIQVHWTVFSSTPQRAIEARNAASKFLQGVKTKKIVIEDFKNSFFPYCGAQIKEYFEKLKNEIAPDIIFTHFRGDLHQDHRVISELTWNSFRDHLILEYEILKYDGDLGQPNFYVPLADDIWRHKIKNILDCFESQKDKHWFTADAFQALMRLRGVESNSPSGYAEAFYCRKAVI